MKSLLALVSGVLLALGLPATAALRLNEVHANPPGADVENGVGYEYIEILSTLGVESCNTYQVILMDMGGGNIGEVRAIWSLNGMSTGSNGLLMLGVGYAATSGGPWASRVAPGTAFGSIAVPATQDG